MVWWTLLVIFIIETMEALSHGNTELWLSRSHGFTAVITAVTKAFPSLTNQLNLSIEIKFIGVIEGNGITADRPSKSHFLTIQANF